MKGLKSWINLHDLSSPAPTGSGSPVLSPVEKAAVEQTAFNDVEMCEAVEEFVKELALYGRSDGMDRRLVERIHALFEKNRHLITQDEPEYDDVLGI